MPGFPTEEKNVYDVIRDYIKHEDTLIHYRLTAFGTLQSFLFATYGLSVQKKLEVAEKMAAASSNKPALEAGLFLRDTLRHVDIYMLLLAITGMLLSLMAFLAVNAAQEATSKMRDYFALRRDTNLTHLKDYPFPTGGGSEIAWWLGPVLGRSMPIVILLVWFAVLGLTVVYWR